MERAAQHDDVVVFHNVSWAGYLAIDRVRGRDVARPRMAYLDGELEVVTTSQQHEVIKKLIAWFVEAYAQARGIELVPFGNATYRKREGSAGVEPDECYNLDGPKRYPDLAIEVVRSHHGIDKLEIYRRLGVAEVWLWHNGTIEIYRLFGRGYRRSARSILRGLDVADLARRVSRVDLSRPTAAVLAYRKSLQRRGRRV